MSNTNGVPDIASEIQALMGHVQSPCILSTTFPSVPVSSLTLAAFATHGFVKDGTQLVYAAQAAMPVTLSGADGQFWLALHRNTSTAVASWTRQSGTHYLWRSNPTKPAEPSGGLILSHVTVAGGVITAVDQATMSLSPLSLQDAKNVAVGALTATGNITGNMGVNSNTFAGNGATGFFTNMTAAGGTTRYGLFSSGDAPNHMQGPLLLGAQAVQTTSRQEVNWNQSTTNGIAFIPNNNTPAGGAACLFLNSSLAAVGFISTNATTTTYGTTSDARLKHDIQPLPMALEAIMRLRPMTFKWNADDSQDEGFLAHELQEVLPRAVVGEPDAVQPDGTILPQGVDYSKLVVWLVAALQTLAARVEALEAALP